MARENIINESLKKMNIKNTTKNKIKRMRNSKIHSNMDEINDPFDYSENLIKDSSKILITKASKNLDPSKSYRNNNFYKRIHKLSL